MENNIFVTLVSGPGETTTHPSVVSLAIGSSGRPTLDHSCVCAVTDA